MIVILKHEIMTNVGMKFEMILLNSRYSPSYHDASNNNNNDNNNNNNSNILFLMKLGLMDFHMKI